MAGQNREAGAFMFRSYSPGGNPAISNKPSEFATAERMASVPFDLTCTLAPATTFVCGSETLPAKVAKLLCANTGAQIPTSK